MISSGYTLEDIHEILELHLEKLMYYNSDLDTLAENIKYVESTLWDLNRVVKERNYE